MKSRFHRRDDLISSFLKKEKKKKMMSKLLRACLSFRLAQPLHDAAETKIRRKFAATKNTSGACRGGLYGINKIFTRRTDGKVRHIIIFWHATLCAVSADAGHT